MNWTGGALNRHSYNYNHNHYSGKSYRNHSQTFAQRQHFARLRKERKVLGRYEGDSGGDGDGTCRVFVPDWGRRLQVENAEMGRYEVEEDDDNNNDYYYEEENKYGSVDRGVKGNRNEGRKKTLKEFEELMRVKEQSEREKKVNENLKWRERKGRTRCLMARVFGSEDNSDYDIMSDDSDESASDSQAKSHTEVHYEREEDGEFVHRMEYLLRHDDWAGLKYCRIDTECVGKDKYLSCHSKNFSEESMLTGMNRNRKRKRQREFNDCEADRNMLRNADWTPRKRYEKPVPTANCQLSGGDRYNFAQPFLPMHSQSHLDKWHTITKPIDIGGHISDEDISIRIGSNALRSEASTSCFRQRKKKITESGENEAEEEDEEDCSYDILTEENENTNEMDGPNGKPHKTTRNDFSGVPTMDTISSESLSLANEISRTSFARGRIPFSENNHRSSRKRETLTEKHMYKKVDMDRYEDGGEDKRLSHYYQDYHDTLREDASKENSVDDNEKSDTMTTMIDTCSLHQRQMSSIHGSETNSIGEINDDMKLLVENIDGIGTPNGYDYIRQAGSAITDEGSPDISCYINEANCKCWPWMINYGKH